MFLKLFLLFTIVPIVELYLLIKIGGEIGAFNTILIILLTATAGAYLAKSQGFIAVRNIQKALGEGRVPGDELLNGLLVLVGGFALLTPGFLTDLFGLLLLVPFTRKLYLAFIKKIFRQRIDSGKWNFRIF